MLVESVSVKNFKLFGDFAVKGLRPVTLLGGDNGCGKTTLLEAVFMCFNMNWGNENVPPILDPLREASIADENALERLFHGKAGDNGPITVSCVCDGVRHAVKVSPDRSAPTGNIVASFSEAGKTKNGDTLDFRGIKRARIEYNDGRKKWGPVVADVTDNGYRLAMPADMNAGRDIPMQFITFMKNGGLGESVPARDANILTQLEMRGEKETILKALQIAVPRASDIGVGSIRDNPLVFARMNGGDGIPSILLGAGAQKALSLALALNSNDNGLFLLDEVTVGWHHSHLVELWRMILRVCRERNHQVIATTHSDEGVTAFVQAATDEGFEKDVCYVRLDSAYKGDPPGKVNPMFYDYGVLAASRRTRVEVR